MNVLFFVLIFIIVISLFNINIEGFYNLPLMCGSSLQLSPKLKKCDVLNLKKGQTIMTNILFHFDRICRKYNLKYWCVGGTLIGVIRHKGWVPWDADIDVAMIESDYLKLEMIIQKELPEELWFQNNRTDKNYSRQYLAKIRDINSCYKSSQDRTKWHNGLQLDIFVFRKDKQILRAPYNGNGDIRDIEYSMIFPVKEKLFEDIRVYIPNKYSEYCVRAWGENVPKILDINKRYPHEGIIDPDNCCPHHKKLYPALHNKNSKFSKINYHGKTFKFPKTNIFNDGISQVWVNYTGLTTKRPQMIFDLIRKTIQIKPKMKILDIGCGCAELGVEFDRHFGDQIDYTGVDIIDDLIYTNKLNLPNYKFYNVKKNNEYYNNKYDIVMFMGYGHSMTDTVKKIVDQVYPRCIIMESHIGKNENFKEYDKVIRTKYNQILSKNIYCGEPNNYKMALQRHLAIYFRR